MIFSRELLNEAQHHQMESSNGVQSPKTFCGACCGDKEGCLSMLEMKWRNDPIPHNETNRLILRMKKE